MFGIEDFDPPVEHRYAMGLGASLMAGWTLLLIWADRKPVERRGVLPLTIFPVIFGIALSGVVTVAKSDLVEPNQNDTLMYKPGCHHRPVRIQLQ